MSVCGLDIGSNTFSYTELTAGTGGIEIIRDASLPVRLSEDLHKGGELKPAAVARGLKSLKKIAKSLDLGQKPVRAVGTAALRMARNPEVFTAPATEIIGVEVEIISGEEEALLAGRGAVMGLDVQGELVTVDIGGQSTEICWKEADGSFCSLSLSLGVVDLTARLLKSDPPTKSEMEDLRSEVRGAIVGAVNRDLKGSIVGVAGTATTLGWLDLDLDTWQREKVHGLKMSGERIAFWLGEMTAVSSWERHARYGIRPVRADVFPAGLVVLDEVLKHLRRDSFVISANGLRIGVALSLLNPLPASL
jgi:exopolyphosphatase/guanosine-5'-triphosphate,3'-diphosphate pyrophosphatase